MAYEKCQYDTRSVWGKNCDTPLGLRLREMYADPTKKVLVKTIAHALGSTPTAVYAAISKHKLQRAECFRDGDTSFKPANKAQAVRKHAEPEPELPQRITGRDTLSQLLPPLPSLQMEPPKENHALLRAGNCRKDAA